MAPLAINLFNTELTDEFTLHNKIMLKSTKNHANWFIHFEDE